MRKFSAASWSAARAVDWKHTWTEGVPGPSGQILYSCDISLVILLKGVLQIRLSVDC